MMVNVTTHMTKVVRLTLVLVAGAVIAFGVGSNISLAAPSDCDARLGPGMGNLMRNLGGGFDACPEADVPWAPPTPNPTAAESRFIRAIKDEGITSRTGNDYAILNAGWQACHLNNSGDWEYAVSRIAKQNPGISDRQARALVTYATAILCPFTYGP